MGMSTKEIIAVLFNLSRFERVNTWMATTVA